MFLHSGVVSECHLDTPLSGTLDVLKRFCYLNVLYNYVYIFCIFMYNKWSKYWDRQG